MCRLVLGLSVINHFHVMLVLGLAASTVHISLTVSFSFMLYVALLGGVDITSGLSVTYQFNRLKFETLTMLIVRAFPLGRKDLHVLLLCCFIYFLFLDTFLSTIL